MFEIHVHFVMSEDSNSVTLEHSRETEAVVKEGSAKSNIENERFN